MGEARDVARQWFESAMQPDKARAVLHPDVTFETPVGPPMHDLDQIEGFLAEWSKGFPDAGFELKNTWEVGDTAIVEGTYTGTNTGAMKTVDGQEMPPTGKAIDLPFVSVIQAKDGQMLWHRVYWDQMGFLAQLGLAPK